MHRIIWLRDFAATQHGQRAAFVATGLIKRRLTCAPVRRRPRNGLQQAAKAEIGFDYSSNLLPSRKIMQWKPFHFYWYCQGSPTGIWSTNSASIGLNGDCSGSAIAELRP